MFVVQFAQKISLALQRVKLGPRRLAAVRRKFVILHKKIKRAYTLFISIILLKLRWCGIAVVSTQVRTLDRPFPDTLTRFVRMVLSGAPEPQQKTMENISIPPHQIYGQPLMSPSGQAVPDLCRLVPGSWCGFAQRLPASRLCATPQALSVVPTKLSLRNHQAPCAIRRGQVTLPPQGRPAAFEFCNPLLMIQVYHGLKEMSIVLG